VAAPAQAGLHDLDDEDPLDGDDYLNMENM
jgi:hypothetical protein